MLHFFSVFILALAVSLDSFGVGMTYGLRRIKIPFSSIAIISLCSGIVIFISMQIGIWLALFVSPSVAKWIGGALLIGLGIWVIFQMKGASKEYDHHSASTEQVHGIASPSVKSEKQLISIELKRLGLVIQILKTPAAADTDRSGNISASEATLLGAALSLDAFGAGIGAALIGFSPVITAASIAAASGVFIAVGRRLGQIYSGAHWIRKLEIVPGCILIMIGIMRLF